MPGGFSSGFDAGFGSFLVTSPTSGGSSGGSAPQPSSVDEDALAGGGGVQPVRFTFQRRTKANLFISDDIADAVEHESGGIEMDSTRAAVRTCNLTFVRDRLPVGIDFAVDHVAIFMGILVDGFWQDVQLGLFRIDRRPRSHRMDVGAIVEAEGADVAYHLLRAKSAAPTTIAAMSNIMDAVRAEIEAEGLSAAGIPVDSRVLPVARTWAPKTSRWERVVDLCRSLNYYDPWARADGSFTTAERIDPSLESDDVAYSTVLPPRMVLSPFDVTDEETDAPNRFAVLIDHPARNPEYALKQNDDPASPVSTVVTDIVTTDDYSNDLMYDVVVAGEYASFELQAAASLAVKATLRTALDPRRDVHETYLLVIAGVEESTRWRQIGWTMPLEVGGEMQHDLASAAPVVIVEGTS